MKIVRDIVLRDIVYVSSKRDRETDREIVRKRV